MKKRLFFHLKAGLSAAMFLLLVLQSGHTQGFFTKTDHAPEWSKVNFDTLPNGGYRLTTLHFHPLADVVYYLGTMDLAANGQVVSWDSVEGNASIYQSLFLLPHGDFATYTPAHIVSPTAELSCGDLDGDGSGGLSYTFTPGLPNNSLLQCSENAQDEVFVLELQSDSLPAGGARLLVLYKFSGNGQLLWTHELPLPDSSAVSSHAILPTQDGGCAIGLYAGGTYSLRKISAAGQLSWADSSLSFSPTFLQENGQGGLYAFGAVSLNSPTHSWIAHYSSQGQLLWTKDLNLLFQKPGVRPYYLIAAQDGGVLVVGDQQVSIQSFDFFFARFDAAGNLLWNNQYPFLSETHFSEYIAGGRATTNNGFVLAGRFDESGAGNYVNFILKIGADGNIYPGALSGKLGLDDNVNCLIDSSETPLANWKLRLNAFGGLDLFATTNSAGQYHLQDVPGGSYTLDVVAPSTLWESCNGPVSITIPDTGSTTLTHDFPIQILADCPFLTVDIATPVIRPCSMAYYQVHFCNEGTITADSVLIAVSLDPLLSITAASIPYTEVGGVLYFAPGPLVSLACGEFDFQVMVDCAAELGQTLCVSASIFPDSICEPPAGWSGALLEGSGHCDGDSVHFQLRNIGQVANSTGLKFIVVEDHILMFQQSLPSLSPSATFDVSVPAHGTTWRLIADQEPNAPGQEIPSVGVEGCGTGVPSWGFLLQFPNSDGNPFTDRDCHEVVGSYDPNDKQAQPRGVQDEHLIEPNTPLEYQIRFQNTGTDTAFTIVLRDTLSPWLDPATVRPGAASHPYTWSLSNAGILTFRFDNILLPDSNVNEVNSQGFIQFRIDQHPDNPLGAILENRAGIYFDFNAPVITNTVWHTIGHNFLPLASPEPAAPLSALHLWPNPAIGAVTVQREQPFGRGEYLLLRNVLGQEAGRLPLPLGQTGVTLPRHAIPAGVFFVEIRDAQGVRARGKVVWE